MDRRCEGDKLWRNRFEVMGLGDSFEFVGRDWTSDHGHKARIRCKACGNDFLSYGLHEILRGRQSHLLCIKCGAASDGITVIARAKAAKGAYDRRRNRNRSERFKAAVVDWSITIDKLIDRDGMACYICGKRTTFSDKRWGKWGPDYPSIDHVIPLSRGGNHSWENVRLCCGMCNAEKGTRLLGGLA